MQTGLSWFSAVTRLVLTGYSLNRLSTGLNRSRSILAHEYIYIYILSYYDYMVINTFICNVSI